VELASVRAEPAPAVSSRRSRAYSLLELDPDLGVLLDEARRESARRELLVRVRGLQRGGWAGGALGSTGADHLGLLVISGAIAREVELADTISTELFGPGDLIRPWSPHTSAPLLPHQIGWHVLESARLAVLDRDFGVRLLRYPEINAMLLDRLNRRGERAATLKAITSLNSVEARLLALFWHLAEDWGRKTTDGVLVPLRLSHRLIGELVGARRPTVSAAAGKLAREGRLTRRDDASWLLAGDPPTPSGFDLGRVISHRPHLPADVALGGEHRVSAEVGRSPSRE
jgi:CRP/FNR family transcriptional regulator, cyclic AMP receptor protein